MAEGSKVGEAFVQIGADASQFNAELDKAQSKFKSFGMALDDQSRALDAGTQKLLDSVSEIGDESAANFARFRAEVAKSEAATANFAQSIRGNAATATTAVGRATNAFDKFTDSARGFAREASKLGVIVGLVVGLFTGLLKIGNKIEEMFNRKAVAAEKARNEIARLNGEFAKLVQTFNEARASAEESSVRSAIAPFAAQLKVLQEQLADPDINPDVRAAIIKQAQAIGKLRNETEDEVRKGFAEKRAKDEAAEAKKRADAETAAQKQRLDEFQKYADEIYGEMLDERGKIETEFYARKRELEAKGFTSLIEDLEKLRRKRLAALDEEDRKREKAAEDEKNRQEEITETMIEGVRRVADEQARRAGNLPDGLSAASGEESTRLLRKIARATSASRYSGYSGIGTGAF